MSKTATDIIERALTLIDEVVTTFDTAATTEASMSEIASDILPEVCRDLVKNLPWELKRYLAVSATLTAGTLSTGEDQSSYHKQKLVFVAPEDFWELVTIRLTAWAKPVTDYLNIDSPYYAKQNNPFTRAGKQNPVVAISNTNSGSDQRIECFSINEGDDETVDVFEYISFDNVPDDDGTTWPDQLFDLTTKALANQLNIIKGRMDDATIKGQEITNNLEQH
jgi:hypothetical protein